MKAFVTGSEGFIGRHLVRALEADGHRVFRYDVKLGHGMSPHLLKDWLHGCDVVFHLAALADVRDSLKQAAEQIRNNLLLTHDVLEAMGEAGVKRIVFTSTAIVADLPAKASVYAAMKQASEALIASYCQGYGMTADILRLVSVVGAGYQHGNLLDFYRKLKADPTRVELFGSPQQIKYYIAVEDVVAALLLVAQREHAGAEWWNVSNDQPNVIQDSIDAVSTVLDVNPPWCVSHGDPWVGDNPDLVLDCEKLMLAGWLPLRPIKGAMEAAVRSFQERGW